MTIINLWTGSKVMLSASYEPSAAAHLWSCPVLWTTGPWDALTFSARKVWLQYTSQTNNREGLSLNHPLEHVRDLPERDTGLDHAKRKYWTNGLIKLEAHGLHLLPYRIWFYLLWLWYETCFQSMQPSTRYISCNGLETATKITFFLAKQLQWDS